MQDKQKKGFDPISQIVRRHLDKKKWHDTNFLDFSLLADWIFHIRRASCQCSHIGQLKLIEKASYT